MYLTAAMIAVTLLMYVVYKRMRTAKKSFGRPLPSPSTLESLWAFLCSSVKNNMHDFAMKWAQNYGDIFEVSVAAQRIVFVNDSVLAKKIFSEPRLKEYTNDRPPSFIGKFVMYNDQNVAFTYRSPEQRKRRKIFHNVLKFYGENVCRVEAIICKALESTIHDIASMTGKEESIDISYYVSRTVLQIVHILLAGEYSEYSEEKLNALKNFDRMWARMFVFESETLLQPFPFLRLVPGLPFKKKYEDIIEARTELERLYYHEAKATHVKGQERGIIDHLISAQMDLIENGDHITLSEESVKASVCETTVASYVTTNNTVNIMILYILHDSKIQDKIYAEICDVVRDDPPSFKHRHLMPYTEAAIIECLRHTTISPFLLPHYSREDVEVDGYHLHKDSIIMMNAWYCHRRPDHWPDPWKFRPERLLDENGSLLPANGPVRQNIIAFGAGSRSCPGEAFARSRMFLIVVSLLQKFEFYPIPGEPLPSIDPRDWPNGYVCKVPASFKCGARLRDSNKS